MLRAMFGMGGSEILVILIVALLFLGPDKLPEAAKQISKGIRDIKKQSRALQRTIEDDENIGGAIRDLRSALRGEDEPIRPKPSKPKQIEAPTPDAVPAIGAAAAAIASGASVDASAPPADAAQAEANAAAAAIDASDAAAAFAGMGDTTGASFEGDSAHMASAANAPAAGAAASAAHANGESNAARAVEPPAPPKITLPPTAGEADDAGAHDADADVASLVKPAPNTIARGSSSAGSSDPSETKHG